ncbi:unnamed protein product [Caenorhabditis bovis]|uniref:Poly [ADP-ribose] polymerase n=1 Tax=Caenorhabditis bovis TaxID=2654633 RepID=A0A8S1E2Z1_9PELO|nr:unnamed protein product [Caenorhabditis bovis]
MARRTNKKNQVKRLDGQKTQKNVKKGLRHSTRVRVQTVLHQAPVSNVEKRAKRNTTTKKVKKIEKTVIKKIGKGIEKLPKVKSAPKRGNDRLVPRDDLPEYKENPFFTETKTPEPVSTSTYYRWLIRACRRNNITEIREYFKSNRALQTGPYQEFSYICDIDAFREACQMKNSKHIQEFFKLMGELNETAQKNVPEPNLLDRRIRNRSNRYMVGVYTRPVEMARGGKEGNNAFLNYDKPKNENDALHELVQMNVPYTTLFAISKMPNQLFREHDLDSKLVVAVRMGHRELASAIAQGPARNNLNELHRLTLKEEKLPEKILAASVLMKGFTNRNITPIHTAAISKDSKMLEIFRSVCPNLNIPDSDNWYTIHYAAASSGSAPLIFLLKNGATVSVMTKRQQSPLHVAAKAGRTENVKIIIKELLELEKGEDGESATKKEKSMINARTRSGLSALHLAVIFNRLDTVEALCSEKSVLVDNPTSTTTNKLTPLMLACGRGFLEMAKKLISHGALIEGKDKKKRTPLIHAAMNGQTHIAAFLLSRGANVHATDSSGNSSAHYSAAYGFLDCLKLFATVDPNTLAAQNDWKLTPSSVSYLKGHYGIVTWMFEGPYSDKVDINAKDNDGATLLSSLLKYLNNDAMLCGQIEYLIKKGADASLSDSVGNTPLHIFAALNIIFKGKGGPEHLEDTKMTEKQYKHCFELLLSAGGSVEAVNQQDKTPMHIALENGNLKLFDMMFEKCQNYEELFEKWDPNENILHKLLTLPFVIYGDKEKWINQNLSKSSYNVLPILTKLNTKIPELLKKFFNEPNKEGCTPMIATLKAYTKLSPFTDSGRNNQNFVSLMCHNKYANMFSSTSGTNIRYRSEFVTCVTSLFEWVIRRNPEVLLSTFKTPDSNQLLSLPVLSMNITLEKSTEQSTQYSLFKLLMNLSKENNCLREFFNVKNELGHSLVLLALYDSELVEIILDAANNAGILEVHSAVKQFIEVEGQQVEVNQTLAMLFIQNQQTHLIRKLNVLPEYWCRLDSEGSNIWHYAARINNHQTVGLFKFIEERNVPRVKNLKGRHPLHEATLACDGGANTVLDPITWLAARTDVSLTDNDNRTALHYAFGRETDFAENSFFHSQLDPISVVMSLTASMGTEQINLADCNGNTVLHLAAMRNAVICMTTFIRKNGDIEKKNNDGNTPLALAVKNCAHSVALTLIQANADVNAEIFEPKLNEKETKKVTEWYWRGLDVKKEAKKLTSTVPSHVVSLGGNWDAMVYVLIDVLGQNTESMFQLADAALKKRKYNLANQLLKSLQAISDGKTIKSKYDLLNTFAEYCNTFLTFESIDLTVLDRILDLRGLNMDPDESTMKIIQTAISNGNWKFLEYLKSKLGQDVWSRIYTTNSRTCPLRSLVVYLAENEITAAASNLLHDLAKQPNINIDQLYQFKIPERFKLLNVDIGDLPPISWAALCGKTKLVRLLRKAGASLKSTDNLGRTCLMFAFMNNDRSVVDVIIGDGEEKTEILPKSITNGIEKSKTRLPPIFGFSLASQPAETSDNGSDNSDNDDYDEDGESNPSEKEDDDEPAVKKPRLEDEDSRNAKQNPLKIIDPSLFLQKDNQGRNPLHYLIEPIPWENVEMLQELAKANLECIKKLLIDKTKPNPIELAAKNVQRRMKEAMYAIVKDAKLPRAVEDLQVSALKANAEKFDCVDEDCQKFMEKWSTEHDKKLSEVVRKPHKNSTYQEGGELLFCDETNQYFDVLLNKTDLNYGRYGFHNFYRMQLIKRRDCDLFILFTNWGRIGDSTGEVQTTPFNTFELAKKEFKSVWKSKTGNEWVPLDKFVEQKKKYRLVKNDKMPANMSEIDIPEETYKKEEIDPIKKMIRDISRPDKLKEYSQQLTLYGTNIRQPFGRFTKENIAKAREILDECEENAKEIKKLFEAFSPEKEEEILAAYMKANELSTNYYNLIPSGEFEFAALARLDDVDMIAKHRMNLNRYEEIEVSTRICCAAAYRSDIDRTEYVKKALETDFRMETPTSDISQRILEWVHNSGRKSTIVKGIVEILPRNASEKFAPFSNDTNQMYLCHGTRSANLMSILYHGFLADPPQVCRNGQLFGPGIYLADTFCKSSGYCEKSADGLNYMLICQVALGKVREIRDLPYYHRINNKVENPVKGEDTLHYIGEKIPSGSLTYDGIAMPLLPLKSRELNSEFRSLDYSEYIVRNAERILPRFIVMFE